MFDFPCGKNLWQIQDLQQHQSAMPANIIKELTLHTVNELITLFVVMFC